MIRMIAWLIRSELTTAPIVVRLRCSAIGPSSSWRATATSPSLPSVGISVLPVGGADGEAPGDADAPGDAEAPGEADADGDAAADGEADGPAEPDGAADPLGAALGEGSTSTSPTICSVLISMKPDPVWSATGLEALLGEDVSDLLRGHGLVLEPDLPARAAGVVDGELEARRP